MSEVQGAEGRAVKSDNAAMIKRGALEPLAAGSDEKGKVFHLKVPKGTKDYSPQEMAVRENMFSKITQVFKKHGGVTIDTPVFELKDILAGKYGEDSKLIYDLKDQGGEICSLRYDLTVPFARWLAMNPNHRNVKRYQIGKVYRRDQPAITKGRMREFYQCDFDIAGQYDPMLPDSEALRILVEVLDQLEVGKYIIKVNHRKILDGIFTVCGVPEANLRPISSAVDKLDKLPWIDVRKEMIEEKDLDVAVADRIGEYVKLKGGPTLCDKLLEIPEFVRNKAAVAGVEDMKLLFKYLSILNVADKISFDISLARGLDYYTGVIYEAVLEQTCAGKNPIKSMGEEGDAAVPIGAIAAGGRYDEMVEMFSGTADKSGAKIPCVGLSIGVERVFAILWKRAKKPVKSNATQVLVMSVGDALIEERMKICLELWENGINAEFVYKVKPKMQPQFNQCDQNDIPYAVIIGKDEVENGFVMLKTMHTKVKSEGPGLKFKRTDMTKELQKRMGL